MIYNGVMMFLWIGLKVPQDWVQDVFNSNSVAHLNVENVCAFFERFKRRKEPKLVSITEINSDGEKITKKITKIVG